MHVHRTTGKLALPRHRLCPRCPLCSASSPCSPPPRQALQQHHCTGSLLPPAPRSPRAGSPEGRSAPARAFIPRRPPEAAAALRRAESFQGPWKCAFLPDQHCRSCQQLRKLKENSSGFSLKSRNHLYKNNIPRGSKHSIHGVFILTGFLLPSQSIML